LITTNFKPILYSLLVVVGILIGSSRNNNSEKVNEGSKINRILKLIDEHYVDTLDEKFEEKMINLIIKDLDPHTTYIPKKEYKNVNENMSGEFSGIGIEFNIINDTIVVVSPISNGPSEKLGIISGDKIIKIDGENFAGIGLENDDVIKNLRGKQDTYVNVYIQRNNLKELIEFKIKREQIPIYSIDASIMLDKINGYIKINRFSATTIKEFDEAIKKLKALKVENLILDLRDNPGGYLHAAASISDEFLKKGELIVFTEGRNRDRNEIFASSNGKLEDIKVIILINEGSASASEIIAGAIQDNDRGEIVGRRSFGKGLVQEEIKLDDGTAIRLTTQRYYTPSGRCIQKEYGESNKDYYMEQYLRSDSAKVDTIQFLTKNGRIVYAGGGITPDYIIQRDTSLNYRNINYLFSKGWISEFCIKYAENNRSRLKNTSGTNFNFNSEEKELIIKGFLSFLKKNEKEIILKNSEIKYLSTELQARISRGIYGKEYYYKIKHTKDKYILKAIEVLNN
jgi:carboxyl-terminal processing protease